MAEERGRSRHRALRRALSSHPLRINPCAARLETGVERATVMARMARLALHAIYESLAPKPTLAVCQQIAGIGGVPSNRTTIEYATYLITSAVLDADPREVWALVPRTSVEERR